MKYKVLGMCGIDVLKVDIVKAKNLDEAMDTYARLYGYADMEDFRVRGANILGRKFKEKYGKLILRPYGEGGCEVTGTADDCGTATARFIPLED